MALELIHKEPESTTIHVPILFIHGLWHAAWCWAEKFQPYFAQHGFETSALSLRGHGNSTGREKIKMTPLVDFVSDVEQVVAGYPNPPVLVGHSMGGMVVQKYLETHQVPGAVLLGSAPPRGLLSTTLRLARKYPLNFLKVMLTFNLKYTLATQELYKEFFFFGGIEDRELAGYYKKVSSQEESMRAFLDMVFLGLPHPAKVQTNLLVLGAEEDQLISPKEVRGTAKAYQTRAEIFPAMGHAMMLDQGWKAVADRIMGWLGEQGL
jgi:pimeloyl-ACP methyl ester carboxylesterase